MGVLLMKVTFGSHPRVGICCQEDNHVIRGLELSITLTPLQGLQGRERGWRLNQPMANDLINHGYVKSLCENPRGQLFWSFSESFHVRGTRTLIQAPSSIRTEAPSFGMSPYASPYVSLHLNVDSCPFSYPLINW